MIKTLDILNDTWEVRNKIGQGAFSQLLIGKNIINDDEPLVAIKITNNDNEGSIIRWEGEVLRTLSLNSTVHVVPKFIYQGNENGIEYLVMELLGGDDMSHLRNRIRQSSGSGLVSLPAATYLASQMLECLKYIHSKGYVHRDVKPSNFVRKSKNSTKFCLIDFGITKQYLDSHGNIIPKRSHCEFRGTTLYASPHTHRNEDLSPRDDLYSLIYVFLDLICGKLPWTDEARNKQKSAVAALKEMYVDDPEKLVTWVSEVVASMEVKHNDTCKDYDCNFPPIAQYQCVVILQHLKSLEYESTPDYALIERSFHTMIENPELHDVSNPKYSQFGFNWSGGSDKQLLPDFITNNNYNQTMKIITSRNKHIKRSYNDYIQSNSNNDLIPLQFGKRWLNNINQLIQNNIPLSYYDNTFIESVDDLLKQFDYFYKLDLGVDDSRWDDFVIIQKNIVKYIQLKDKFINQLKLINK
mmetsp:Transcript_23329/g.21218  ORF Transcript_23329/g.21218 Transcript_23329/m.21218 type:complete len:468 (-) Transcript_23329:478-1881(-)